MDKQAIEAGFRNILDVVFHNNVLLSVSIFLMLAVSYRAGAMELKRDFLMNIIPNIALVLVLGVILYRHGGASLLLAGVRAGSATFTKLVPLLAVIFLAVGFAYVIGEIHKEAIVAAINNKKYGLVGSAVAGMLMPSGLAGLPIVKDLWLEGASKIVLVTFLIGSSLVGIQMMLFRVPYLNWAITGYYFVAAVFATILFICSMYLLQLALPYLTYAWGVTEPYLTYVRELVAPYINHAWQLVSSSATYLWRLAFC